MQSRAVRTSILQARQPLLPQELLVVENGHSIGGVVGLDGANDVSVGSSSGSNIPSDRHHQTLPRSATIEGSSIQRHGCQTSDDSEPRVSAVRSTSSRQQPRNTSRRSAASDMLYQAGEVNDQRQLTPTLIQSHPARPISDRHHIQYQQYLPGDPEYLRELDSSIITPTPRNRFDLTDIAFPPSRSPTPIQPMSAAFVEDSMATPQRHTASALSSLLIEIDTDTADEDLSSESSSNEAIVAEVSWTVEQWLEWEQALNENAEMLEASLSSVISSPSEAIESVAAVEAPTQEVNMIEASDFNPQEGDDAAVGEGLQLKHHFGSSSSQSWEDGQRYVQAAKRVQNPYELVMYHWLPLRRPLAGVPDLMALKRSDLEFDNFFAKAPICKRCGEHLRLCGCEHCGDCGDLTSTCSCKPCQICFTERNQCDCKMCPHCGCWGNERLKKRCDCYCADCGIPMFNLDCCKPTKENFRKRSRLWDIIEDRHCEHEAMKLKVTLQQRMYEFVEKKYHFLSTAGTQPPPPSARELGNVSGRYKLVFNRKEHRPTEKISELIISQNEKRLWGRIIYGDDIRGLFSTHIIPTRASTIAVPVEIAVVDWTRKDGTWKTHIRPSFEMDQDPDFDVSDGIVFLGNGLIKISPKMLGGNSSYSCCLDFITFGVRQDDDPFLEPLDDDDPALEDHDTFQELWRHVHKANCGLSCPDSKGFDEAVEWRARQPQMWVGEVKEWDEDAIDDWVSRLYEVDKPVSKQATWPKRFIMRNSHEDKEMNPKPPHYIYSDDDSDSDDTEEPKTWTWKELLE
jgi:hypothetical protein